ncbi:MAG: hypothetical protein VW405_15570 [Rhodospirillaceae bacterium]
MPTKTFVKVRHGLLEHLSEMREPEIKLYIGLLLMAAQFGANAGTVRASEREIADQLGWGKSKVNRWLTALDGRYIQREKSANQHGETTIRILKFGAQSEESAAPPAGQHRGSTGAAPGQQPTKSGAAPGQHRLQATENKGDIGPLEVKIIDKKNIPPIVPPSLSEADELGKLYDQLENEHPSNPNPRLARQLFVSRCDSVEDAERMLVHHREVWRPEYRAGRPAAALHRWISDYDPSAKLTPWRQDGRRPGAVDAVTEKRTEPAVEVTPAMVEQWYEWATSPNSENFNEGTAALLRCRDHENPAVAAKAREALAFLGRRRVS